MVEKTPLGSTVHPWPNPGRSHSLSEPNPPLLNPGCFLIWITHTTKRSAQRLTQRPTPNAGMTPGPILTLGIDIDAQCQCCVCLNVWKHPQGLATPSAVRGPRRGSVELLHFAKRVHGTALGVVTAIGKSQPILRIASNRAAIRAWCGQAFSVLWPWSAIQNTRTTRGVNNTKKRRESLTWRWPGVVRCEKREMRRMKRRRRTTTRTPGPTASASGRVFCTPHTAGAGSAESLQPAEKNRRWILFWRGARNHSFFCLKPVEKWEGSVWGITWLRWWWPLSDHCCKTHQFDAPFNWISWT